MNTYHKINTFHGEQRWMEQTGKSMKKHCTYSGMEKGTSWAEVTFNSKIIKPEALPIAELCKSEGIS